MCELSLFTASDLDLSVHTSASAHSTSTMGVDANSGSRLGLGCSGPRVHQIFGALGACWYVSDRFLASFAHSSSPVARLSSYSPSWTNYNGIHTLHPGP